jgi:S-formylglutathione hydrolase FrmB
VAVNLTYADNATTNTIAGTTAAAAIIGGAMAGARNARAVGALAAATLAAQVFVVLFSRARDPLSDLFGAGETQQSMLDAAKWVSRTESLLAGLIAGLVAYLYLAWARRRDERRDGVAAEVRWPAYLVAGAGAGLLLLLTEVIIRVGGRGLLDLAAALSEADQVAQTALGTSRVDNAIWVLFVGALTALILFGRTLGPRAADDEDESDS